MAVSSSALNVFIKFLKIADCRDEVEISVFVSEIHSCRDLGGNFSSRMKGNVVSELLKFVMHSFQRNLGFDDLCLAFWKQREKTIKSIDRPLPLATAGLRQYAQVVTPEMHGVQVRWFESCGLGVGQNLLTQNAGSDAIQ